VAARVQAQAKINLCLRVLAREASGYHQIETVFCRLALADSVTVLPTDAGRALRCTGEFLPARGFGPPERNLAWRAAAAYAEAAGWPAGFDIQIEKRIPVGGGLGGGSADAGAVLRALDALNPAPLPQSRLLQLAGTLGADVPFLTQAESPLALAWGRGDRMVALPALPERPVELFVPPVAVSTKEAYQWLDERPSGHDAILLGPTDLSTWSSVARLGANDFEGVVAEHVPAVGQLLSALRDPGLRESLGDDGLVLMSGSGSTVCVVTDPARHGWIRAIQFDPGSPVRRVSTRTATFVEPVVLTH
jgi:4-diphosphocytidyl-2-C-methyl-D-erythritol kinase